MLKHQWAAALVLLALAGCGTSSPAATSSATQSGAAKPAVSTGTREKLRIGYSTLSASNYLAFVTKGAGLYEKYGIEPEMQFMSPATVTAAMVSGDVDVAYSSSANVPTSNLSGADLVAIGAVAQHPFFAIVARPGVAKVEDLNDKKVAVTQAGATTDVLLKQLIAQKKLTGVTVTYLPDATAQLAALQNGTVDAVVNSEPQTSMAIQQGAIVIYDQSKSGEKFVGVLLAVRRPYLTAHRELLKRFLMANLEGIHLMKTKPSEAAQYPGPYLKLNDNDVLLHSMEAQSRVTDDDLNIPLDAYQSVIDMTAVTVPGLAKLHPQDLVDLSLLDEIKASHFIENLNRAS